MAIITAVNTQGTLAILELNRFKGLHNDMIVNEIIHLRHGGGNGLSSSVGGTVVLTILFFGTLRLGGFCMLCRDQNGVDLGGDNGSISKLIVRDSNLGLTIGTEPPKSTILTNIGELLAQLVGKKMRQGHATRGLIGGVSKHDTLITSTDIHVIFTNVNTTGNIGGLLVDTNENLAGIATQSFGVDRGKIIDERRETNLANLITYDLLIIEVSSGTDLTKDHDHVVLCGSLASDLGKRVGSKASIKDGIGDLIAELVRVALVDRLGGKEERTDFDHGYSNLVEDVERGGAC
mmetsp:Transcript_3019/g.5660  ORF Transcript_3019/g.5660 Transcript_3019/m.5660 type:complete len:291 (+) Transcript_3019:676-1548(+)